MHATTELSITKPDDWHLHLRDGERMASVACEFIFTDPMQADDVPDGVLQPVYDRLNLNSLGSFRFYRQAAEAAGFEVLEQVETTAHLRTHYARVREDLLANYERLQELASSQYLDKMLSGLGNWVQAADAGHLAWGIHRFRKPG